MRVSMIEPPSVRFAIADRALFASYSEYTCARTVGMRVLMIAPTFARSAVLSTTADHTRSVTVALSANHNEHTRARTVGGL